MSSTPRVIGCISSSVRCRVKVRQMTYDAGQTFVGAHERKLLLYEQMELLSTKLEEFSDPAQLQSEEQLAVFQTLLNRRGELIRQIDQIDEEIYQLKERGLVPPSDGELDRIIDSLRRIGQRIQTSNGNIGSFLEKGMTELRQETKKVQEGRQSSRAYTRKGDLGEGFFIDKRR